MRSHAIRLRICLAIGLSTCTLLLSALSLAALGAGRQSLSSAPTEDSRPLTGVEIARTLATVTGIAITPLLGMSAEQALAGVEDLPLRWGLRAAVEWLKEMAVAEEKRQSGWQRRSGRG